MLSLSVVLLFYPFISSLLPSHFIYNRNKNEKFKAVQHLPYFILGCSLLDTPSRNPDSRVWRQGRTRDRILQHLNSQTAISVITLLSGFLFPCVSRFKLPWSMPLPFGAEKKGGCSISMMRFPR
ncbi:uncharacterized protein BO88DRAFT_72439 [Aspergillus vadensis CBS 113365]|uniref:Uncharacterized protein n=1 Tax=Aspergillus vadensis (strain CBS 113365 / IMI 142717 / IBT 24658) TaxID=1448311 RepID=A0A319B562_ASPVC|nr:hypothetical protein BO88DRAFT_72439 [Aspergillus vadensis CBS 113365]PYH67926.1 hypothetical protein BO88DRAFT_72439 [Aspergillus vadensis CBS 113365]